MPCQIWYVWARKHPRPHEPELKEYRSIHSRAVVQGHLIQQTQLELILFPQSSMFILLFFFTKSVSPSANEMKSP